MITNDMDKHSPHTFRSANGEHVLDLSGTQGRILSANSGIQLDAISIGQEIIAAAISNNRKWVAAAVQNLWGQTDLYVHKKQLDGTWSMTPRSHKRNIPIQSLAWEEAGDSRYHPIDLIITQKDGMRKRMSPA